MKLRLASFLSLGLLAAAILFSGCATLPDASEIIRQVPPGGKPPRISSVRGLLSVRQSEAILKNLKSSADPSDVLERQAAVNEAVSGSPLIKGNRVVLLVDGVQEPGNLGAIARAAEAFGVRALALTHGCVHPNHPRALRASAGSLLRLVAVREVTAEGLQSRLAPSRARWIGLAAHGGRPLPASFDRDAVVLCCGAEGTGLSAEVECQLDERWTIPLDGRAESLNVAVAVGIALYAMRSASRRATP